MEDAEKMIRKNVTMPPSMVERLEQLAARERRSFAQMVRMLIEAGERNRPYPSLAECPADTDES